MSEPRYGHQGLHEDKGLGSQATVTGGREKKRPKESNRLDSMPIWRL